jgi:hypothetical protein
METKMRRTALGLSILLFSVAAGHACGVERWPVKVGEDRDVAKVATEPQPATIAQLVDIQPPTNPSIRKSSRYSPVELTTYEISGRLTLIKLETDDDDYHLVVTDNRGRTIIVEAPLPECAANSRFEHQIREVRQALDAKFGGPITSRQTPDIPVTVTGVGFFDRLHNQEGVAPNGIELHPILEIVFE